VTPLYYDCATAAQFGTTAEQGRSNRVLAAHGLKPCHFVYHGTHEAERDVTKLGAWYRGTGTPIIQDFNEPPVPQFRATLERWRDDNAGCRAAIARHLQWVRWLRNGDPDANLSLWAWPGYGTTNLAGEADFLAAIKPITDELSFLTVDAYMEAGETYEQWEARIGNVSGKWVAIKPHFEDYSVSPVRITPNPHFQKQLAYVTNSDAAAGLIWTGYADVDVCGAENMQAIANIMADTNTANLEQLTDADFLASYQKHVAEMNRRQKETGERQKVLDDAEAKAVEDAKG
jgi:hypothetical protein